MNGMEIGAMGNKWNLSIFNPAVCLGDFNAFTVPDSETLNLFMSGPSFGKQCQKPQGRHSKCVMRKMVNFGMYSFKPWMNSISVPTSTLSCYSNRMDFNDWRKIFSELQICHMTPQSCLHQKVSCYYFQTTSQVVKECYENILIRIIHTVLFLCSQNKADWQMQSCCGGWIKGVNAGGCGVQPG